MRRSGKIVLIVLFAVLLAATLIACDPTEQSGGTGPGGSGGGQPAVAEPYALQFEVDKGNSLLNKALVEEFNLSRDVRAYVLMRLGDGQVFREGDAIEVTEEMIVEEDRAKLGAPYDGLIRAEYEYKGKTIKGAFELHLKNAPGALVTLTLDLGDGKLVSGGKPAENGWTVSLPEGTYGYAEFVSRYGIIAPKGYALGGFEYDGGVFEEGDSLVVKSAMTLTAVYTANFMQVSFDLNAPADITWSGGSAPSAPAAQNVAFKSTVPKPLSQDYSSENYTLIGWSESGSIDDLWNFGLRLSSQTDARDGITLKAVWVLKSRTATFDLKGGTFTVPEGYEAADTTGKKEAQAVIIRNADGSIGSFSVSGITHGDRIGDYYVTFEVVEGEEAVTLPVTDIDDLLTKGSLYDCGGLFVYGESGEVALTPDYKVEHDFDVLVKWMLDESVAADENYYANTYTFELKPDDTYALGIKDRNAELLYIPAEHDGKPVTEILPGAFAGMSAVTAVDFSAARNLRVIGSNAFFGCGQMEVRGAESLDLTFVGKEAFYGTRWLNEGDDDFGVLGGVLVIYRGDGGEVDVPEGVDYIASYAFTGSASKVQALALPESLKGIEDNAFPTLGIGSADKITVTEGAEIEFIGSDAFAGSAFVTNPAEDIKIGNVFYLSARSGETADLAGMTVVAEYAFAGHASLAELENENGIVSVGRNAFRGTALEDEDGFVIVNGILAGYYGNQATVFVPDEAVSIAPYAFGKGVEKVVFGVGSKLGSVSDYAFAGATGLLSVHYYPSKPVTEIEFGGYALANAAGSGLVTKFATYATSNASESASGALAYYLQNGGSITATSVTAASVTYNRDVFVSDLVDDGDGVFTLQEFADAWGGTLADGKITVPDGISVTRTDGIVSVETFVIEGLDAVNLSAASTSQSLTISSYGAAATYPYTLHAAVDKTTISLEGYKTDGGKLLFFSSQKEFDTSGTVAFKYSLAGGQTADGSIPANSPDISTNYTSSTGDRDLIVTYKYFGKEYKSNAIQYTVRNALPASLKQTGTAVLPLGAGVSEFNNTFNKQLTLDIVYEDGSVKSVTFNQVKVSEVDGAPASALVTSEVGLHSAKVTYTPADSTRSVEGYIVYSVALMPLDIYKFTEDDATATLVGLTDNTKREFYVIPDEYNGKPVTAIGKEVFKGNTNLKTVYLPKSVVEIGASAFEGCTSLIELRGFDEHTNAYTEVIDSASLDHVVIATEHRTGQGVIAITGLEDIVLTESSVTFPVSMHYAGTLNVSEDVEEGLRAHYESGAVITAEYDLTFVLQDADAMAERLAAYAGTVYLPGVVVEDKLTGPVDAYKDLYDLLVAGGIETELYDPEADAPTAAYLDGRFVIQSDFLSTITPERTGTVHVTGHIADISAAALFLPAKVELSEGDIQGVYTVTGIHDGVFADITAQDIDAFYIPDTAISLADDDSNTDEGDVVAVFGSLKDKIHMYDASLSLPSLVIPHESETKDLPPSIAVIGDSAFKGCTSLDLDLSSGNRLRYIGAGAFMGCTAMRKVELAQYETAGDETAAPELVIGKMAFENSGVVEVDLSLAEHLKDLGNERIFYGCVELVNVKLGNTVTQIGNEAFAECEKLESVTDGMGVKTVGSYAFRNCVNLVRGKDFLRNLENAGTGAFENCPPISDDGEAVSEA